MKRMGKIMATSVTILTPILLLGVSSSRTVRAAVATLVAIANTSANPVPATDVGPQQPYVTSCQNADDPTTYVECKIFAPPGKRFVVETVSVYLSSGLGVPPTHAAISILNPPGFSIFYINVAASNDYNNFYTT